MKKIINGLVVLSIAVIFMFLQSPAQARDYGRPFRVTQGGNHPHSASYMKASHVRHSNIRAPAPVK